jgi:heme exporter protein A
LTAEATPRIRARDVAKRFGAVPALAGVSLDVSSGETVALFGPNGAGKTTLLRILSLALRPDAGSLAVDGADSATAPAAIRARIGTVSHEAFLYDDLTARENLVFWARLYGVPDPGERADAVLDRAGLAHRADDPIRGFSRGMRQRVSVARALVHDPAILILDEPFTGLDPDAAETLSRTLAALRDGTRAIVVATHDLELGLVLADRWLILSRGRIAASGPVAEAEAGSFAARYRRACAAGRGLP